MAEKVPRGRSSGAGIWEGLYHRALPAAERLLAEATERGERSDALFSYASAYYSAAVAAYMSSQGDKGKIEQARALADAGRYMITALRAVQERLREEKKKHGRGKAMIPVSLDALTPEQCDIMQSVYRQAAMMVDRIPRVKTYRSEFVPKTLDPIRDFDAAALIAIRAGLKGIRRRREAGETVVLHTEVFLRCGQIELTHRYGWRDPVEITEGMRRGADEKPAVSRIEHVFLLAKTYPWPPESPSETLTEEQLHDYGQAARVAKHLLLVAKIANDKERSEEFGRKARVYAQRVPDQARKLGLDQAGEV